ncbi:MAG: winged helix-turn-helix domain-containing protein, partial [Alphaproteobacteria bacterium]
RDDGWIYASIAEPLFLSEEGVRQQLNDYLESEKLKPENGGSDSFLNAEQAKSVITHLQAHIYVKASDICGYVQQTYGIRYSVSGMISWLQAQNFTFHQPCGVPAKANAAAQEKFIADYENLKKSLTCG